MSSIDLNYNTRKFDVDSELQDIGLEDHYQFDRPPAADASSIVSSFGEPTITPSREIDVSVHDQLPSVEEQKAAQQVGGTSRECRKVSIMIACGIIAAIICITLGVVIGRDSVKTNYSDPEQSSGNEDESFQDVRVEDMISLIVNMGWAEKGTSWELSSPHRKAAEWLADGDPLHLDIDATEELMNQYILATFYFALDGDNWSYEMGWLTEKNVCEWQTLFSTKENIEIEIGVSCHNNGVHIEEIFLPKMNLKGKIPYEIGLLMELEELNLFGNSLTGSLPDSMKNLELLEILTLHDNSLDGTIPSWITSLKNLNTLNLANNDFTGELPMGMGTDMISLRTLVLEGNALVGSLDPLLSSSVVNMYLANNEFKGLLSNELFLSWEALEVMDFSDNYLHGVLPEYLFGSQTLSVVDLHDNEFEGSLPSTTSGAGSIQFLALQNNNLKGTIGAGILSLKLLSHLDLSMNMFTGAMPTMLGSMKSLKYLYLAFNNHFTAGSIPVQYATLPHLVDLSLQQTNRFGTIPYQFEGLSKLIMFDVVSNRLSGEIPFQLGEMQSLQFLMLKNNSLMGTIPATMQGLSQLNILLLDHNQLSPGYESICEPALPNLVTFIADCGQRSDCECCNRCCSTTNRSDCNEQVWYSGVDPVAENGYMRDVYFFNESDIIFPAPKNVKANHYTNFSGYNIAPPPPP